jgi:hypothetical protein
MYQMVKIWGERKRSAALPRRALVIRLVVHRDEMCAVSVATVLCFVPADVACEGAHAVVFAPVVVQIVPVLLIIEYI